MYPMNSRGKQFLSKIINKPVTGHSSGREVPDTEDNVEGREGSSWIK
jgi:hypothetical protein